MAPDDAQLLKDFCPIVHLHPEEPVAPIRIEEYIQNSTVVNGVYMYSGEPELPYRPVDDVPFYGKVDRLDDGGASLLYMFMYPYNAPYQILGCYPVGAHLGDLEHVRIEIANDERIVAASFGQHAKAVRVLAEDLEIVSGKRVAVYSARGSHACYASAGIKLRWNTALFANDVCGRHYEWNATSALVEPWPPELLHSVTQIGISTNSPTCQFWWTP